MPHRTKDRRADESAVSADRRQGADRREYQRILVDLEVDYQCEDTFLFAYITDLSALGIFVRTNNPEPPGTHLNLRFTPPGEDGPLELEGEVIWINPFRPGSFDNINPGMGVQFTDITPELKHRLVGLVRKIAYLADADENPPEEAEEEETSQDALAEGAADAPQADTKDEEDFPTVKIPPDQAKS